MAELNLDRWLEVADFSDETLLSLVDRLERSDLSRHWILREAELDDLWRHVEAAIENERRGDPASIEIVKLEVLFQAVSEAHDLTGEGRMAEAAERLRAVVVSN